VFSNGQVKIWNYETQTDLKTFEVTDVPVRCVRYIARKNWVSAGEFWNACVGRLLCPWDCASSPHLGVLLTSSPVRLRL
jgi:hypothetical protein